MKSLVLILAGFWLFLSVPALASPKQGLKDRNAVSPPTVQTSPSGLQKGTSCHLEPGGKEGAFVICKHCGCRMRIKKGDEEKPCTVCKCGKKQKECRYR